MKSRRAINILIKKKNVRYLILLKFKNYYKAIVSETVKYWHKDRKIDQWNQIESQE